MRRRIGSETSRRMGRVKFFCTSSRKSTSISSCLAWMPQFFVRRRRSAAFSTRMTGGYVSERKRTSSTNARKPIMVVMYIVHRQPR